MSGFGGSADFVRGHSCCDKGSGTPNSKPGACARFPGSNKLVLSGCFACENSPCDRAYLEPSSSEHKVKVIITIIMWHVGRLSKPCQKPQPGRKGDSDVQLQQLNRLRLFARVIPVSYDYLKELNCSGAAFLICNASLGLTGKKWLQCRNSVNGRSTKLRNKSPPHAAIDVVRLARDFYEIKQALRVNTSGCKPWPIGFWSDDYMSKHPEIMTSVVPAVIQVAKQIPVKCERFAGLFQSETEKWFSRTGAKRPTSGGKDICTADVASFKPKHWQLIGKLAPDC